MRKSVGAGCRRTMQAGAASPVNLRLAEPEPPIPVDRFDGLVGIVGSMLGGWLVSPLLSAVILLAIVNFFTGGRL